MSAKRITRVSADELDKLEDKTDWSRVDKLSDADIRRAMRDDPDWTDDLGIDWSKAEIVRPRAKKAISIRLDQDVLDFFKAAGSGYQKRINEVLRSYVRHRAKETKKRA